MKSGVIEPSRPSRWDALRRNNDAQSTVPTSSSRLSHSNDRRRRLNEPQKNQQDGSNSSASCWRRCSSNNQQQANNSSRLHSRTTRPAEEVNMRQAIANVRAAINNENDNCNSESVTELNMALFGIPDPIFHESPLLSNETNLNMPLSHVSDDMKWEAAYSLIQMLSQSTKNDKSRQNQFILCITRTASACLHLLSSRHDDLRPSLMSDLRLSECVKILLDVLQLQEHYATTKSNGCSDLLCKSNIFLCISKLVAVSYIHGGNGKNPREGRGPLWSWGAEKAVTLIIKENALPFLEGLMCSTYEAQSCSIKLTHSHGAVECIYLLLRGTNEDLTLETMTQPRAFHASKHAAAMLAALVVDVMPDGKENQRTNPLRRRILRAVNACWRWSCESIYQNTKVQKIQAVDLEMTLRCMTVTFNTLHALERGKVQNKQIRDDSSEINVSLIARDIKTLLDIEELKNLQPQILRLMTSLCLAYPVSTANQWHLFLDKTGSAQPFLLSTVEEGTLALRCKDSDSKPWILLPDAVQTVSSLISSIPFTTWIGGDGRPSTRMSGGNFASRVRNAIIILMTSLMNLITTVKDNIFEGRSRSYESLFELLMMQSAIASGKLCTLLPFTDNNIVFVKPAVQLVQCAGDIFVLSARALEGERANRALLTSSMAHFSHVITTIEGDSSISVPVKHWLTDASSYDFIGILLNDSYSAPTMSAASKCKLEMLTSVAKAAPWSITREPFNLASFREICANLCNLQNDTTRRLLGVKLIEAFILGRKAYVIECTSEKSRHNMELSVVPESFCPLLHSALSDNSSAVRTCAVTSFGSLLVTDWVVLLSHGSFSRNTSSLDWTHVDSILRMCTLNGEKIGNVRSAACKAVGDICTVCVGSLLSEERLEKAVPFSDDFVVAISTKVCSEMEQALKDETVSVRSMALFAIGNTSLALKDRCAFLSMHRMLPLVYACIDDKDDKVVGNAIRTIGHVSYFVYTPEFLSNEGGSVSDDLKLYCSLLSYLTTKIHDVVCDSTGEASRELTWKQRNSAKKHAWGAATTIGILLGHTHLLSHFDDSLVESALLQLFRCIQFHAFINEKIFAAAVNALSALSGSLWQYLSTFKKCDIIARGLATFFNFLESPQRKAASLHQVKVKRLANALILKANRRDFCQLLLLRESLPFSIDFFYQWMVSCDVPSATLEEVVDAVTSQEVELVIDVSDIQIFLSRTAQHNQLVQDESMQSTISDDEDEL